MNLQRERFLFWTGCVIALLLFIYLFKGILLPFVVGVLVAYFLDPVADRLTKAGISRGVSTGIITTAFFVILFTVIAVLTPVLVDQFQMLAGKFPDYIKHFQEKYGPMVESYLNRIDAKAAKKIGDAATDISGQAVQFMGVVIENILKSWVVFLNLVGLMIISPVVSFYMLRDWDKMVDKVNSWLPRDQAPVIRAQIREIDNTLSGYIRGMTNVCLVLALFYSIGLIAVGLEFGLIIGLATGIFTFIPYVGFAVGMIIGLTVAFFQFPGEYAHILMVFGVFMAGQFLESNVFTPRLVGKEVNLHPVWIIFGVLAGGSLFGFTGVLLSVPATAAIGVIARFWVSKYLMGEVYNGKTKAGT